MLAKQQAMMEEAMGFVNEKIPEEDKERFGLKPIDGSRWTIDRERDVALLVSSTNRYRFSKGKIFWKGEALEFTAECALEEKEDEIPMKTVHWKKIYITLPEHLQTKKNDVIQTIEEAFMKCGHTHNEKWIKGVTVEFHPNMNLNLSRGV